MSAGMNAIVCADRNWGIGREGALLVRIPEDLRRFKALTTGHAVILGRKTLATFPGGRPLPGRRNLVLSRDPEFQPEGVEVFRGLDALLKAAAPEDFVIGGAEVYRQLLPYCGRVYVTRLDEAYPADAFFPDLDACHGWRLVSTEPGGPGFRYDTYEGGRG